jgi:outer membrane protein OmpA-like peptidoglycan-associated protein
MRIIFILIFSSFISHHLIAQTAPAPIKRGTFVVQAGAYDFLTAGRIRNTSMSNVLGNNQWADLSEVDFALGASYIKGITSYLDYSVNGYFGFVRYPVRQADGSVKVASDKLLTEIDGSVHLKLLPDNFTVVPYLSAGLGASASAGRFEAFTPLGAGLQVKLIEDYFFLSNFQYRVPVTQGANYHFLYSIGFGGPVGKPRAVAEPKAAPVAPVAAPEPPKDTDGDGVVDTEDKCPTVAGVAKYQGCPVPDSDNDGVNDENDKCPTVAGVAKYQGCPVPDTDKDGINDDNDKCPTVAGTSKYQGCPVPDTDGDGLNDEQDKCPTVAGISELYGCPRPALKAENVLFNTGSATLIANGKTELDIIVDYLKTYQGFNVKISGHTDNTGNDKINQPLSEKRAEAAKTYVVSKGVDAGRITTEGLGSTKPIADNKTAAGRKLNRRVEFSIVE